MLRKILLATVLLTPLVTFAQSSSAWTHANGNASFKQVHAPEIDGGNAVLGLALLGGIISLMVNKKKKHKKDIN
jgi:hypothetical protein